MTNSVSDSFESMGARVNVQRVPRQGVVLTHERPVMVDIRQDSKGAYFQIDRLWNVTLSVADAQPGDRHLLLVAQRDNQPERFSRFLCGFDERSWFVAAVPESAEVASVQDAKNALKPEEVWDEIRECQLPEDQWNLRWTAAFLRQGEWFFLPRPWMEIDHVDVLRDEPVSRGGGKPHWCQFLYRTGGVRVFVSNQYPNGLTEDEYRALDPVERRRQYWQERTRDAEVYARGRVQHPDHATIDLPYWHKVVQNTETRAKAMENVAFLD